MPDESVTIEIDAAHLSSFSFLFFSASIFHKYFMFTTSYLHNSVVRQIRSHSHSIVFELLMKDSKQQERHSKCKIQKERT